MNVVYLLLGSNLNDRLTLLQHASEEIALRIGIITGKSSVYESEPWGFESEKLFLDQVIRIETNHTPRQILDEILKIEVKMGRKRSISEGYTSRLIDIDILFFNDKIIKEDNLTIPHPKIPERKFTLLPLAELDSSMIYPGSGKSIRELISECRDQLKVYPYNP